MIDGFPAEQLTALGLWGVDRDCTNTSEYKLKRKGDGDGGGGGGGGGPGPCKKPWRKVTAGDAKHCMSYQTQGCENTCPKGKKHEIAPYRRTHKAGRTCFNGNVCFINHDKAA